MRTYSRRPVLRVLRVLRVWWPWGMALVALMVGACERSRQTPPADSAAGVSTPPAADSGPPPAATGWDAELGPALFVAGAAPGEAVAVFPEFTDSTLTDTTTFDLTAVGPSEVELFTRAGSVGRARVALGGGPRRAPAECTAWPTARVERVGGSGGGWQVAFPAGRAVAIPLDSIEDNVPADSALLAAAVTRLASALPGDTVPMFRGLPFLVRSARRFSPAPGVDAVIGQLVRKVNQEANPREEHLMVIGERPAGGAANAPYAAAYVERVSGLEETIEASDVLAAVQLGAARTTTLVIGRDYGDGMVYALVERAADGRWRLRWSSAYAGC
jgi:hypothetical protein